ncbi:MAG: zinc-dependent metalloprotease, partial [Saprospiraceae bacterium]|nr:zinc-dependent metalloprotease [Saprospiraceae bacterium]
MKQLIAFLSLLLFSSTIIWAQKATPDIATKTKGMKSYEGFFTYYWDEAQGKIWLEIKDFDKEFLYVNSLSAGIGSNDIGLDRNQLGGTRVVTFKRIGPKVMMVQPNYDYRAVSDNPDERESVADAFARSVIWGGKVEAAEDGRVLVDLSSLLMADAHNIVDRLKSRGEGSFKIDAKRSAVHLDRTKNFPKNSEFEAIVTYAGNPQGRNLRSVAPNGKSVSVRLHHSFVELPDDNYQPRAFHPGSGYGAMSFADYATPISQSLVKRFIRRHRLEKKDPTAAISEAVEPIVYYLDRGAPEPIRSALIEGASWWNQAFEAAGFKDAFQVKLLPADADPLDVRYNVINWVHRSTRGWSYGSSVTDPRTGEIIKGHVLLGSLRVRQDFMIAQGLVAAYENGETPDPRLEEMALARLRQLSAHEVGHTLGIMHNFAASVNDRASVMDYPHPYIAMNRGGKMDFDKSYEVGIGDWDKRVIIYGYKDYPDGVNEKTELAKVIQGNINQGFHYITDRDARPPSGANPLGHLWDNGVSAVGELKRLNAVRAQGLANFSEKNIPVGAPMGTLENVLVPLYLMHRYQVEAVSKVIGGINYTYASRGDGQVVNEPISPAIQKEALSTLLITLNPDFLQIPEHVI